MLLKKLSVNVGESTIYVEVHDKQVEPKFGDTTYRYRFHNVLQQGTYYGDDTEGTEDGWLFTDGESVDNQIDVIVAYAAKDFKKEEVVIRILNNDPNFDPKEYLTKEVGESE